MSDHDPPEFDRHRDWQRWQMGELNPPEPPEPGVPDTTHQQSRVDAARRAAEQARQREAREHRQALEQARAEAAEEGRQQGFKAGHQEGYAKGLEAGRHDGQAELEQRTADTLAPLGELIKAFSDALARLDESLADQLVELALQTGRKLALDTIDHHPQRVLTLVRDLLHSEPPLIGSQRLWLHPDDHRLVEAHLGSELEAAGWTCQPDDQLSRGGCRVTSRRAELDATFEQRWQSIAASLRERE